MEGNNGNGQVAKGVGMAKKKVLVVEDSPEMQLIYKDMFAGEDAYEVDIVGDVSAADRNMKKTTYDIVLLDIIMEPVGGDAFFFRLRESEDTKKLPVIVISVLTPSITQAIKRLGNVEVLQKPVKKEILFEALKNMIG